MGKGMILAATIATTCDNEGYLALRQPQLRQPQVRQPQVRRFGHDAFAGNKVNVADREGEALPGDIYPELDSRLTKLRREGQPA